jgi:hypothetical protein
LEIASTATITIAEPAAVVLTPHHLRATGTGTTPAGVKSISFINDGDGIAYIGRDSVGDLVSLLPNESLHFAFVASNYTYGAMEYDATGTSLRIDYCT